MDRLPNQSAIPSFSPLTCARCAMLPLIVRSMKLQSSSTPYLSLPKQLHGKFVWHGFQFPPMGPFSRWGWGWEVGGGGGTRWLGGWLGFNHWQQVRKSLDSENGERCVNASICPAAFMRLKGMSPAYTRSPPAAEFFFFFSFSPM